MRTLVSVDDGYNIHHHCRRQLSGQEERGRPRSSGQLGSGEADQRTCG